jgi:hypothetical protein
MSLLKTIVNNAVVKRMAAGGKRDRDHVSLGLNRLPFHSQLTGKAVLSILTSSKLI